MALNRRELLVKTANLGVFWRTRALSLFKPSSPMEVASSAMNVAQRGVTAPSRTSPPKFDDYASVEAVSQGEPVYGFDYMMYVYGISPDLMPGTVMQEGNPNSWVKIRPKKSWEIEQNLLGSNSSQVPRSRQNDSHPTLPIHLIDGDPNTVWCSFGSLAPDVHPEWIRIDLPIEATVTSIKLVCSNTFYPDSNFGRALPRKLIVKLSTDAWHWDTIYLNENVEMKAQDGIEIQFAPRRAKQIWITGDEFLTRINTPSSAGPITFFSIASVEVRDTRGENLALVSRGAGVTVSSTYIGHADNRLTQAELWAPLQYDMGMKWLRIAGGEAGAYDWQYTERERGRYEFDPILDAWLDDVHRCGIKLIWGLDIYANPIYANPPRDTDWEDVRLHKFTDGTLNDLSLNADCSDEMFDAYLRYVEVVVRHLKGRVSIYEVGNEFTGCGWDDDLAKRYMRIFSKSYEVVKRIDPEACIMPASPDLFAPDYLLTLLGQPRKAGIHRGTLLANGGSMATLASSTLLLSNKVQRKDIEISVNALNRGRFGIVLRYKSPESFVVAGYGTCWPGAGRYSLVIAERIGNSWEKARMSSRNLDADLSQNVRLRLRSEGNKVTLEVSDGDHTESLAHQLSHAVFEGAGSVGLLQLTGALQAFSEFSVRDLQGEEILREEFSGMEGSKPSGWRYVYGPQIHNPIQPGWAPKIDGIGWHPYNPPDKAYFEAVREFQRQCEGLGFKGRYYASELYNFFTYPPRTPLSELQHGIASAISVVGHTGVDAVANTQIVHFTGHATADSNCRIAWPSEVITPVEPSVMYYVWRTLATVLDGFRATAFPIEFDGKKDVISFTFCRFPHEPMVGVWLSDPAANRPNEITDDLYTVTLRETVVRKAWAIDILNGVEQELVIDTGEQGTIIRDVRIKSYPTLLRFLQ